MIFGRKNLKNWKNLSSNYPTALAYHICTQDFYNFWQRKPASVGSSDLCLCICWLQLHDVTESAETCQHLDVPPTCGVHGGRLPRDAPLYKRPKGQISAHTHTKIKSVEPLLCHSAIMTTLWCEAWLFNFCTVRCQCLMVYNIPNGHGDGSPRRAIASQYEKLKSGTNESRNRKTGGTDSVIFSVLIYKGQ